MKEKSRCYGNDSLSTTSSQSPTVISQKAVKLALRNGSFLKDLPRVIEDDGHVLQVTRQQPVSILSSHKNARGRSSVISEKDGVSDKFEESQFGEEKSRKMHFIVDILQQADSDLLQSNFVQGMEVSAQDSAYHSIMTVNSKSDESMLPRQNSAPAVDNSCFSSSNTASSKLAGPSSIRTAFGLEMASDFTDQNETSYYSGLPISSATPEDSWRFLLSGQSSHHDHHCLYCRSMNQELSFVDSFVTKVGKYSQQYKTATKHSLDGQLSASEDQSTAMLAAKSAVTRALVEINLEKRKVYEQLEDLEWYEYQKYCRTVEEKAFHRAIKRAELEIISSRRLYDDRLRALRELDKAFGLVPRHSMKRAGPRQLAIAHDLRKVNECLIC